MEIDPKIAPMSAPIGLGHIWWMAIRPRTLSIAVAPVILGSALAWADGSVKNWPIFIATLICALLIQIGTNLHNDVVDFERGTDQPHRIGPLRVTSAGWISTQAMHRATQASYGLAMVIGLYLVAHGGWPIFGAGLTSVLAGWAYSGGPRPVSHTALGEVFVLVFFGLVAVTGSHWLQSGTALTDAWLCGAVVGLPAAAVLMVNNYRDLDDDVRSGRCTLAARVGRTRARTIYSIMLILPFFFTALLAWRGRTGTLIALIALPYFAKLAQQLRIASTGPELNTLLAATAKGGLLLSTLLSVGVFL